ncbi:MAG: PTPA-CTERM sorting domain-containing protein [Limnothrix sp. RL_2_0]|nr:PTPA-CTERM sorting domain-containing protein [Limnothrix sp. RL_2_0]
MGISKYQIGSSFISISLLTLSLAPSAQALTFKTFTNIDAFQAATTRLNIETFNSTATSTDKNHDLTDFNIRSDMTWTRISEGTLTGNINNTNFLQLQSRNPATSAALNFYSSMSAIGFDWVNTDNSGDTLELIIDGQSEIFGAANQKGFFGIIALDGLFDSVEFSDTEGGGYLQYAGIDNIRYGYVQDVPTPTAILPSLFGIFVGLGRRKQTEQP